MFDCSDLPIMQANFRIDEKSNELIPGPGSDPRDTLPKGVKDSEPDPGKKLRNPVP